MSQFGKDTLQTRRILDVGGQTINYYSLAAASAAGLGDVSRLPFSLKVLLENLLRWEDGRTVTVDDLKSVAAWLDQRTSDREIAFRPARVLMQDFTGVPAVVDLAAMRDAMVAAGRRSGEDQSAGPGRSGHRPLGAWSIVRHRRRVRRERATSSSSATASATSSCAGDRTPSTTSASFRRTPASSPGQPRISRAGRLDRPTRTAQPSPIPTRSSAPTRHTTMINGLGVLGWGVGGIEAEAAMLGQPISMLIPEVVGFKLTGTDAGGRDRHRPGADRHPDAAQERRGRQVRRVFRPGSRRI